MKTFNGIPISEIRVLVLAIVYTILFLALAIVMLFWLHVMLSLKNPKERLHIKRIRERSATDEAAKKQLEKIERKNKRRRERRKGDRITEILFGSFVVCFLVVLLVVGVMASWIDYAKKDYVVYTGDITVYEQMRHSHIELDDGTTVWGIGDFEEEDTCGTVVYSKRTKQFLGGRN